MSNFDRRVIISGAISGLFFALPAAILQRTVFADTAMAGVMLAIILFAGALAGFGAALPQPPHALKQGAAAGLLTFLGAQLVYIIATQNVNPVSIVFGGLLFSSLGIIGAYVALIRGAREITAGGDR